MRILHLVDHFQPWLGYQETYVPMEQMSLGHDVIIITSNRYTKDASKITKQRIVQTGFSKEKGIPVNRLPVYLETPTHASYVWLRGLSKAITEFKPDIVHCHGVLSFTSIQAALLKKQLGYALICDNHTSFLNLYPTLANPWKKRTKLTLHQILAASIGQIMIANTDVFVAIGEDEQTFLAWLFHMHPSQIPIIRLGADSTHYAFRGSARHNIRQKFGWLEDDIRVLGHAGTLRPSKDLDLLLQSCAMLGEDSRRVRILLVGSIDSDYQMYLLNLATQLGLGHQVEFSGFVTTDELPNYLSAMDIAVWPGDISITVIEAMSVGLPVITCRTAYTEAIIEKNNAGYLFMRSSVDGLASTISELLLNEDDRLEKSKCARAAVDQDLNWNKIASLFVDLYQGIVLKNKANESQ